ncbi:MAG: manganese efflux pump [Candidatus Tumulicola sp.]
MQRVPTPARKLGVTDITLLVMGSVIGSGIFRTPAVVARRIPASASWLFARVSRRRRSSKSMGGLIAASASISLDSLGIGISLPGVPIALLPLLATVAVTTVLFTIAGLSFGQHLGESNRTRAQLAGGIILIVLAVVFAAQRAMGAS